MYLIYKLSDTNEVISPESPCDIYMLTHNNSPIHFTYYDGYGRFKLDNGHFAEISDLLALKNIAPSIIDSFTKQDLASAGVAMLPLGGAYLKADDELFFCSIHWTPLVIETLFPSKKYQMFDTFGSIVTVHLNGRDVEATVNQHALLSRLKPYCYEPDFPLKIVKDSTLCFDDVIPWDGL